MFLSKASYDRIWEAIWERPRSEELKQAWASIIKLQHENRLLREYLGLVFETPNCRPRLVKKGEPEPEAGSERKDYL